MCNCEHASVEAFSCKRRERSERKLLQFLIETLLYVALFQLVEGHFPQENIAFIFRIEQWKNYGF